MRYNYNATVDGAEKTYAWVSFSWDKERLKAEFQAEIDETRITPDLNMPVECHLERTEGHDRRSHRLLPGLRGAEVLRPGRSAVPWDSDEFQGRIEQGSLRGKSEKRGRLPRQEIVPAGVVTCPKALHLSLSAWIFIGLGLGVLFGLFFGELCRPLNFVGKAFIKLLQMGVLPYMVVTLDPRCRIPVPGRCQTDGR